AASPSLRPPLAGEPGVEATLGHLIGSVYRDLDLTTQARPLLERALATRRRLLGERDREVATYERDLGILMTDVGENEPAARLLRQALATEEALLGPRHPEVAQTAGALGGALPQGGGRQGARASEQRAA